MRVTLVTTWDRACGISEHSFYLKQALEQADPTLQITVERDLHPHAVLVQRGLDDPDTPAPDWPDWIILNYHAALHSQWHPEHVQHVQARGAKVLVIYHDSGVPSTNQCLDLYRVADAFVVHEHCPDLPKAIYLRQGVPEAVSPWWHPRGTAQGCWPGLRPIVGSIGFPFPWKHYDLLADASEMAGWALLLIAPGATADQVNHWGALNPHSEILTHFMDRHYALAYLTGCDATAFLYGTMNAGTSGAIRQGIAVRKPVIASEVAACRQFRDLVEDPVGRRAIQWVGDLSVDGVARALAGLTLGVDPRVVHLAHQDRWGVYGARVAQVLRAGKDPE